VNLTLPDQAESSLVTQHQCPPKCDRVQRRELYFRYDWTFVIFRGRNKWISLHTKIFSVAKLELYKQYRGTLFCRMLGPRLPSVRRPWAIYRKFTWGASSLTAPSKLRPRNTGLRQSNICSGPGKGLKEMAPAKISETECRQWAALGKNKVPWKEKADRYNLPQVSPIPLSI
jgi:hypothetical protein